MRKKKNLFQPIVFALLIAGCSHSEFAKPSSRQNNLVIYDAPTEFVRLQSPDAQRITSACRKQFEDTLASWAEDASYARHFGIMYGGFDPATGCTFASDGDAGTIDEIARVVESICEHLHRNTTGGTVVCHPVAIARPKGVNTGSSGAIGKRQADALLEELSDYESGFGSMAIAADGRWSVYVEPTRAEADRVALFHCRKHEGLGLETFTQDMRDQVKDTCTVVYRFGPDFPGSEQVNIVRPSM